MTPTPRLGHPSKGRHLFGQMSDPVRRDTVDNQWPASYSDRMLTAGAFRSLCQAREVLREAPEQPVTIRDVARVAAMSPFHFIRQFQAVFGATPHQYRIQSRLDRAKHLLATSDSSITDVCMEVGFSSLGSFSDLFARRVGAAPSAYRRRVRSIMTVPGEMPKALTPGCLSLMATAFAISEKRGR
jgi:AraC-like DNA-binding protein